MVRYPAVKRVLQVFAFLALLAFPALEITAHAVTRSHVPAMQDWRAAASFVRC